MTSSVTISIAKDFSKYPAGGNVNDGKFTGEHFREDYLIPALEHYDQVCVDLDGVRGLGSAFIEEAFAGLIRYGDITYDEFKERIVLVTDRNEVFLEIHAYVSAESLLRNKMLRLSEWLSRLSN